MASFLFLRPSRVLSTKTKVQSLSPYPAAVVADAGDVVVVAASVVAVVAPLAASSAVAYNSAAVLVVFDKHCQGHRLHLWCVGAPKCCPYFRHVCLKVAPSKPARVF